MTASLDDYRWLTGSGARPWLRRVSEELAAEASLVSLAARLRRELTAERTHLALEQVELRLRARDKFSRADEMFFTRLGLAQATDQPLAIYKAARFPAGTNVGDLCCGIGGDLLALGAARRTVGIDRDPVAALLAFANADVHGLSDVKIECREAAPDTLATCEAWHIDPDRRSTGQRTVRTERFEPSWEVIESLLAHSPNAAVKLAPATTLDASVAGRCEREWIESRGECRQQVAWFGKLARHAGGCAATAIDTADGPATIAGTADQPPPSVKAPGRYVYEPSAAVRAARLVGALCEEAGLAALAGGQSYLTSDARIDHPLATRFEVLESLPFDLRKLKDAIRQLGIGAVEVKKRGVEVDPALLQRQLGRREGEPGVVLIAKTGATTTAIIAKRSAPRP